MCVWGSELNASNLPFRGLTAADIGVGLLCLLPQAGSAVRILLADRLAVRQVLASIDNNNEGTDLRAINSHVGEDTGRVHPTEGINLGLGRHIVGWRVRGVEAVSEHELGRCRRVLFTWGASPLLGAAGQHRRSLLTRRGRSKNRNTKTQQQFRRKVEGRNGKK